MKNFSYLRNPTSKNPFPKKASNNKAIVNSSLTNNFNKNSSMRAFNQFNNLQNGAISKKERLSSKSIEEKYGRDY